MPAQTTALATISATIRPTFVYSLSGCLDCVFKDLDPKMQTQINQFCNIHTMTLYRHFFPRQTSENGKAHFGSRTFARSVH